MSDHLNADDHVIIEKRKNDAVMSVHRNAGLYGLQDRDRG